MPFLNEIEDHVEHETFSVSHPTLSLEVVTPSLAAGYLRGTLNRRLSLLHVSNLAVEIVEGRWVVSPMLPLAFDRLGRLRNGQHRAAAVIVSEIPTSFYVFRGCGERELHAVDSGLSRKAIDRLTLACLADGHEAKFTHHDQAVARVCAHHLGFTAGSPNDTEYATFYACMPAAKTFPPVHSTVVAAACWAVASVPEHFEAAKNVAVAMLPRSANTRTQAHLKEWITKNGKNRVTCFRKALRCIRATFDGEGDLRNLYEPTLQWCKANYPTPTALADWLSRRERHTADEFAGIVEKLRATGMELDA